MHDFMIDTFISVNNCELKQNINKVVHKSIHNHSAVI